MSNELFEKIGRILLIALFGCILMLLLSFLYMFVSDVYLGNKERNIRLKRIEIENKNLALRNKVYTKILDSSSSINARIVEKY